MCTACLRQHVCRCVPPPVLYLPLQGKVNWWLSHPKKLAGKGKYFDILQIAPGISSILPHFRYLLLSKTVSKLRHETGLSQF